MTNRWARGVYFRGSHDTCRGIRACTDHLACHRAKPAASAHKGTLDGRRGRIPVFLPALPLLGGPTRSSAPVMGDRPHEEVAGKMMVCRPPDSCPVAILTRRGADCCSLELLFSDSCFLVLLLVMASPPRAVPTSADDLVIEDVATLIAEITNQSDTEVMNIGVVETLRAANTVGLLKGKPILQQLALDMDDLRKRRRLETSPRASAAAGTPHGVVDAVASGTVRPSQRSLWKFLTWRRSNRLLLLRRSLWLLLVQMTEAMAVDSQVASWVVADKAPSLTVTSTLADYTLVEHENVEHLQAWIQEQLDDAKDHQGPQHRFSLGGGQGGLPAKGVA